MEQLQICRVKYTVEWIIFFSRIDIIIAHLRLNSKHNERHCLRDGLIPPKNGIDR